MPVRCVFVEGLVASMASILKPCGRGAQNRWQLKFRWWNRAAPRNRLLRVTPAALMSNALLIALISVSASSRVFAAGPPPAIPTWLKAHIGEKEGQIALPVLQRARALYLRKVKEGAVRNPCYFAKDATRPHTLRNGGPGRRFFIICEAERSFRAVSSGHGGGRTLKGIADFKNGRRCAKHFSNALGSRLTTGGIYVTGQSRTSFKGYYQVSSKRKAPLVRTFVPFDGEGETSNAEARAIGGHAAVLIKGACLLREPGSPYANDKGYVPLGKLVDYSGGRSSGCTSWSPTDAREIVEIAENDPTTLYIYPEQADIDAVARAVAGGRPLSRSGLYWNASCLKEIGTPKYWPKDRLGPRIAQYQRNNPAPRRPSMPLCQNQ